MQRLDQSVLQFDDRKIGMGVSKEEAEYYESEMRSGRTIASVNAGLRRDEALAILRQFRGYDMSTRDTLGATATAVRRTIEVPVVREDITEARRENYPTV